MKWWLHVSATWIISCAAVCPSFSHCVCIQTSRGGRGWRAWSSLSKHSQSCPHHFHAHPIGHTHLQRRMAKIVFILNSHCSVILPKSRRKNGYWEDWWNSSFNQFVTSVLFQSYIDNPFHSHSRYAIISLVSHRESGSVYLNIRHNRLQRFVYSPLIIFPLLSTSSLFAMPSVGSFPGWQSSYWRFSPHMPAWLFPFFALLYVWHLHHLLDNIACNAEGTGLSEG